MPSTDPNHPENSPAPPTKMVTVRVPVEIYNAAKKKAQASRRSFSNYLVTLLEQDTASEEVQTALEILEREGHLDPSHRAALLNEESTGYRTDPREKPDQGEP